MVLAAVPKVATNAFPTGNNPYRESDYNFAMGTPRRRFLKSGSVLAACLTGCLGFNAGSTDDVEQLPEDDREVETVRQVQQTVSKTWPTGTGASSLVQTADGGFAFVGDRLNTTTDVEQRDALLVKTDPNGEEEFAKTFGGDQRDVGLSLVQTSDGGFAFTGNTESTGPGRQDVWLVKTDASGQEQFSKTFGGEESDIGRAITQSQGGFAIGGSNTTAGGAGSDFWLVRTDASGNKQFSIPYGRDGNEQIEDIITTSDGGLAVTGHTTSFGETQDIWLLKTDAFGNVKFDVTIGGSGLEGSTFQGADTGHALVETALGGYAIAGRTNTIGAGRFDALLATVDATGALTFVRSYGGKNPDTVGTVVQPRAGGYLLGGSTESFGDREFSGLLVHTDDGGTRQAVGTLVPRDDWAERGLVSIQSLTQTDDGGFAFVGRTGRRAWLGKIPAGEL